MKIQPTPQEREVFSNFCKWVQRGLAAAPNEPKIKIIVAALEIARNGRGQVVDAVPQKAKFLQLSRRQPQRRKG